MQRQCQSFRGGHSQHRETVAEAVEMVAQHCLLCKTLALQRHPLSVPFASLSGARKSIATMKGGNPASFSVSFLLIPRRRHSTVRSRQHACTRLEGRSGSNSIRERHCYRLHTQSGQRQRCRQQRRKEVWQCKCAPQRFYRPTASHTSEEGGCEWFAKQTELPERHCILQLQQRLCGLLQRGSMRS